VQEADKVVVEEEDGIHTADENYEADEVLRMRMVAAKNEEKSEWDQEIQNDTKGMVIAEGAITVPLEEKSAKSGPLVYTSNQEVKNTPIEEISIEDKEVKDAMKLRQDRITSTLDLKDFKYVFLEK